jgi:hypothetical protein
MASEVVANVRFKWRKQAAAGDYLIIIRRPTETEIKKGS